VVEGGFGPEPSQQADLLLDPRGADREVDSERVVLHRVPADAHAEPEPPRREQVEGGDLLGHQRGLALRKDEHVGHQREPGGLRQPREEHERFEERIGVVVEAVPVGTGGRVGAEHVVVDQQVIEAGVLEPLHERDDLVGIHLRELRLREHRSEVQRCLLAPSAKGGRRWESGTTTSRSGP
jgi:hypothetical protein